MAETTKTKASTTTSATSTVKTKIGRQTVKSPCLWGLVSRSTYNITINLKDGDAFILAPRAMTPRQFNDGDIVSVEGLPLQTAISRGFVTYLR